MKVDCLPFGEITASWYLSFSHQFYLLCENRRKLVHEPCFRTVSLARIIDNIFFFRDLLYSVCSKMQQFDLFSRLPGISCIC